MKTIVVYKVLSGAYRAFVRGPIRERVPQQNQAWGNEAEIAVNRLIEQIGEDRSNVIVTFRI